MADTPNPALLALRDRIDAVDRELLALLNRRAQLALDVGEIKKHEGSPVFRPEREAQVIDGLKTVNPGPLKSDSVAPIWREIMSACRSLESPRCACRHSSRSRCSSTTRPTTTSATCCGAR